MVTGNSGKAKAMLTDMLSGCTFESFIDKAKGFKGFSEVALKGGLANIAIKNGKDNKALLEKERVANVA